MIAARLPEILMPHPVVLAPRRRTIVVAGSALALVALIRSEGTLAQTAGAKLRIGTIGAGRIGGTVGLGFGRVGHGCLPLVFLERLGPGSDGSYVGRADRG